MESVSSQILDQAVPLLPDALPPGTRLHDYEIVRVIGQGGFGITYEAVHSFLGRQVAIKEFFILSAFRRGEDGHIQLVGGNETTGVTQELHASLLARFAREARKVASKLRHPGVVQGEAYFSANATSYFVMSYVPGPMVDQWLKSLDRPPTEMELWVRMKPALEAVAYLHSVDELHRDLTPKNIVLPPTGGAVVIDFGASREGLDKSSATSVSLATDGYAPPEQCSFDEESVQGRYTDVYSLGAILYRAVSGKAPISATERAHVIARRRAGRDPYRPVREVAIDPTLYSASFLDAVDLALCLDEDERPQDLISLISALDWDEPPVKN